ncbi:MAG TPA: glycosyltransferase, partial [Candidatus Acetothermia bacterium]|nr:glycosyltransferase [Candidatus Acetothermia bacterium]
LLWHALDSYNPWMQKYIREVVKHEKPDVASMHNLPGWSAASWKTLAKLGVPSAQVLHDHYPICVKTTMRNRGQNCKKQCVQCRLFRLPHRTLSRHVQAVVGVSRFMLERHKAFGYFERVPIQRVIHNARDPLTLGIENTLESGEHAGLRFGYIGRLDPAKGIEPLIEAFQAANLPESTLLVAGSGKADYERGLRAKVDDECVRFLGRVAPREFFPRVDVVVVPSLCNDNFPGVIFEALAFGKPVIGSRRGGIPEMIRDGENGLLFEPDAPGALLAALEAMRNDRLRARLTAQAQPSSAPFVDIVGWINTYEALYREVADAASASSSRACS